MPTWQCSVERCTCFIDGSSDCDGAQFGGWHCRQAASEGAHGGADRTDDNNLLKAAGKHLIKASSELLQCAVSARTLSTHIEGGARGVGP